MNYHVDFCLCDKVLVRVAFHVGMIEDVGSNVVEWFSKKFRYTREYEYVLEQIK